MTASKRPQYFFMVLYVLAVYFYAGNAVAGNPFKGQPLYEQYCVDCHEESGRNWMPTAPDFHKRERLNQVDRAIFSQIKYGKGIMPGFRGVLTDKEIRDVIAHLRTLM